MKARPVGCAAVLLLAAACGGGGDPMPTPTARTIQRVVFGHGTVSLHDGAEASTLARADFVCAMTQCEEMPGLAVTSDQVSFGAVPAAGYHFVSAQLDALTLDASLLPFAQQETYVLTVIFEEDAGNPGCKVQDPVGPAEVVGGACQGFAFDGNPKPSTIICDLALDDRPSPNLARVEFHADLAMNQPAGESTFMSNYQTCNPCLVIFPEQDGPAPVPASGETYIGQGGTLELLPGQPGRVRGRVKNVLVLHSEIDPVTFANIPDPDGCMSEIWGFDFDAELTIIPM